MGSVLVVPRFVRSVRYTPFSSQKRFHQSSARFKGYSGPIGTGKSMALCHEAIKLAYINNGCPGLVGAPTYPMLRDVTLPTFLTILNENEVPHEFSKSEYRIHLHEPDS